MDGALIRIKHRTSCTQWVQSGLLAGMLTLAACNSQPPTTGDTTPPAMPQNLVVASEDEVNLSWQAVSEADLKGYNLYIGTSPDALSPAGLMDKGSTSKILEDLEDQTEYFIALDAEDINGNKSARTAPISLLRKDTKPPKLTTSTPKNGAKDVSAAIPTISFSFNEAIQPDSLKLGCIYVLDNAAAVCGLKDTGYFLNPTWSNKNKTVSFARLGNLLAAGTAYRLDLTGAKDKAGNTMADTAVIFETSAPVSGAPKLLSSFPANADKNVPNQLEKVGFNFDKSMNPALFKVKCVSNTETCNLALASLLGNPTWSDQNRSVSYKPTQALAELTTYSWMLEGKDTGGLPLPSLPVIFTTTDMPRLVQILPAEGSGGNAPDARIALVFHKQMDVASLKAAISGSVSEWDGNSYRPLGISEIKTGQTQAGGYAYYFIPDRPHGEGKVVVWLLGRAAKDAYGNPVPQILSGGFRTLRRYTVKLPVDPTLTGQLKRRCQLYCENSVYQDSLDPGYLGATLLKDTTFVYRGAIGFTYNSNTFPANAQFLKATLTLRQSYIYGTPFAEDKLSSLAFERVNYGTKLDGGDFDTAILPCMVGRPCGAKYYGPPGSVDGPVDVLNYFLADWADRDSKGYHSHFRLRFANSKPVSGGVEQHQKISYYLNPLLTIEYLAP